MKPTIVQVIPLRRVPRQFDVLDYQLDGEQAQLQRGDILRVPFGKQQIQAVVWGLQQTSAIPSSKLRSLPPQQVTEHFTNEQVEIVEQLHKTLFAPLSSFVRGMQSQKQPREETTEKPTAKSKKTLILVQDPVARKTMLLEILRRARKERQGLTCIVVPTYAKLAEWEKLADPQTVVLHAKLSAKARDAAQKNLSRANILLCLGLQLLEPLPRLHRIVLDQADDSAYGLYEQEPRFDIRHLAKLAAEMNGAALTILARWNSPRLQTWLPTTAIPVTLGTLAPAEVVNRELETPEDRRFPLSPAILAEVKTQRVLWLVDTPNDARALWCASCGTPVRCPTCARPLQVQRGGQELFCAHDRIRLAAPETCASCGSVNLQMQSKGTAAVRQQLQAAVPKKQFAELNAKTSQPPSDGVRHVLATSIIQRYPDTLFDVVVIPFLDYAVTRGDDFTASERAMDTLALARMHVHPGGKVIIQTFHPEATFFSHLNTPQTWAAHLIEERTTLLYPPVGILVTLERQKGSKTATPLPQFPSTVRMSRLSDTVSSLRLQVDNFSSLRPILEKIAMQGWDIQVNPPRLPRLQA